MDITDFSFMQTGFNQLAGVDSLSHTEKATLLSTLTVYLEEAIQIAEGFVVYEGREEITDQDIILALKAQALDNQDIWDDPGTTDRIHEAFSEIYPNIANPNDLSDSETDSSDPTSTSEIKPSCLDDKAYQLIKTVSERWNIWDPQTPEQQILKTAINRTEQNFTASN
jgi:hypothetical protein